MACGRSRAVIVFYETGETKIYSSILAASRATGVSETRIRYGLEKSKNGAVRGTRPKIYVDTLLEPSDLYDDNAGGQDNNG